MMAFDVGRLAEVIGLKPETCQDLLDAGWTLTFATGEPHRWMQGGDREDRVTHALLAQAADADAWVGDPQAAAERVMAEVGMSDLWEGSR